MCDKIAVTYALGLVGEMPHVVLAQMWNHPSTAAETLVSVTMFSIVYAYAFITQSGYWV